MNRRYIAALSALALSAMAGTSAGAAEPIVPVGTADTVVDIADVLVSGAPVEGVSFGGARSFASTDTDATYNPVGQGKPFATAKVTLPDGTETAVRSDGDTGKDGTSVPLAGVGDLTVGNLKAVADSGAAHSVVNAVEGRLDGVLAGLRAKAAGVNALVDGDDASTVNGAAVEDVTIGLTDVLPVDILAQLPLDKIIGIVDGLGIDLDLGALSGAVDEVRALADAVHGTVDAQGRIDDAQAELQQVDAALSAAQAEFASADTAADDAEKTAADADQTVSDLSSTLSGLQSEYAANQCDVLSALPSCQSLADEISSTSSSLTAAQDDASTARDAASAARQAAQSAQAQVTDLQGQVDALQAEVDTLVATLNELLDDIEGLVDRVVELDLVGLLEALVAGLEGTELVSIDRLAVGVSTVANMATSKATTACEVSGVRVLGQVKPVETCGELATQLAGVETAIRDVLAGLPIQGVLPENVVTIQGPRLSASPDGYSAEGYRVASAKASGMDLTVESIQLTQVADGLVAQVRTLVSGALDEIAALTGVEVPTDEVEASLAELLAKLGALPVGDALNGITTPQVSISAIDLASRSTFRASGSDVVPVPGTSGDLPHTGGGVGLALALLAGGAVTWTLVRRREQAPVMS